MSRRTQDREDLLLEATALVPRLLLHLEQEGRSVEVFAGFRSGNALSLYFDSDPVLHFNSRSELRRAFADGHILKAEGGKLVSWEPLRTATSTEMMRHTLSGEEQERFGKRILAMMRNLQVAIANRQFVLVGQFPSEGDGLECLGNWLDSLSGFTIASKPNLQ